MPVIAITTVCTIVSIALGFLPRPSRATVLWSAAFAMTMIASYLWLAYELFMSSWLRDLAGALAIAPMALIWSGVRAYRRKPRTYVWLSSAFIVVITLMLLGSTAIGLYGIGFRVLFCSTAVFAALIVWELAGLGPRLLDEAFPLIAAASLLVVVALIYVANGILVAGGVIGVDASATFVRTLNFIGIAVFAVCTLVTTLLLTVKSDETAIAPTTMFEASARRRLIRAEAAQEQWWSLLDIRLDDPDEIRTATSTAAFNDVAQLFAIHIDDVFPADADIDRVTPTRFLILVPRPQGGVRELLTELLERVSSTNIGTQYAMRISASIGWVPVSAVGYDFGVLVAMADASVLAAQSAGGDRWERVHGTA